MAAPETVLKLCETFTLRKTTKSAILRCWYKALAIRGCLMHNSG